MAAGWGDQWARACREPFQTAHTDAAATSHPSRLLPRSRTGGSTHTSCFAPEPAPYPGVGNRAGWNSIWIPYLTRDTDGGGLPNKAWEGPVMGFDDRSSRQRSYPGPQKPGKNDCPGNGGGKVASGLGYERKAWEGPVMGFDDRSSEIPTPRNANASTLPLLGVGESYGLGTLS